MWGCTAKTLLYRRENWDNRKADGSKVKIADLNIPSRSKAKQIKEVAKQEERRETVEETMIGSNSGGLPESRSGSTSTEEPTSEYRAGGSPLVQQRTLGDDDGVGHPLKIKVSHGSNIYDVSVPSNYTFGTYFLLSTSPFCHLVIPLLVPI